MNRTDLFTAASVSLFLLADLALYASGGETVTDRVRWWTQGREGVAAAVFLAACVALAWHFWGEAPFAGD